MKEAGTAFLAFDPVLKATGVADGWEFPLPDNAPTAGVARGPTRYAGIVLGQTMREILGYACIEAVTLVTPKDIAEVRSLVQIQSPRMKKAGTFRPGRFKLVCHA